MVTFGAINLTSKVLHLLTQLLNTIDGILFIFPLDFQGIIAVLFLCQFLLQLRKACFGKLVILFFQRSFLDFQLNYFSGYCIQFRGRRIHFRANLCTGFVYQIDCLIRKKPICDIAVGEGGCGDDGRVSNLHTVEHFVAFF